MSQLQQKIGDISNNELEVIEFYIDEQLADGTVYSGYYGMNVAKVLEIIRRPPITGVPGKHHSSVLGTFNLRGRVLPLVDLGMWLGKNIIDASTRKVIVSEFSGIVTAFLVSGVTRIHRMSWTQVEAPDKHLKIFSHDCLTGVVRFEGRIVFILDMEQVIGSMNPSLDMAEKSKDVQADSSMPQYRVLVADDSSSVRHTIVTTMERAGFIVTAVESGVEAWDYLLKLKRQAEEEKKPITDYLQLIISDIEMPEMDGHTLTKQIKGDSMLCRLPVALFSSLITEALRTQGEKSGADEQISKPDLPLLTQKARTLIERILGKPGS